MSFLCCFFQQMWRRVNWCFLRRRFTHIGLGNNMLRWINALYTHPVAAVKVNNVTSSDFFLTNSTRQGCPFLFWHWSLYSTRPETSIPNPLQELKAYLKFQNYKIDINKSEALNITIPSFRMQVLEINFLFKWLKGKLKYFGFCRTPKLEYIFKVNFPPY